MYKINVQDLEIIKHSDVSKYVLKHYISHILDESESFSAHIESVDLNKGIYRIVLQGKLETDVVTTVKNGDKN